MIHDPAHNRRVNSFTKRIYISCKKMKENSKILALYWENEQDRLAIRDVLVKLKKLDLIDFTAGFASMKIVVTSHGRLRLSRHDTWFDY